MISVCTNIGDVGLNYSLQVVSLRLLYLNLPFLLCKWYVTYREIFENYVSISSSSNFYPLLLLSIDDFLIHHSWYNHHLEFYWERKSFPSPLYLFFMYEFTYIIMIHQCLFYSVSYNPLLLIFIFIFKFSQIWPVGTLSTWTLHPLGMSLFF